MLNNYNDSSTVIKYSLYAAEIIFIAFLHDFTISKGYTLFANRKFLISLTIVALGMVIFNNNPDYSNLMKFFGYGCCFYYGCYSAGYGIKLSRATLYGLVFLPLLIVALGDHTEAKSLFFPRSNTFVYWGLCCSILYYTVSQSNPKALLIAFGIVCAYILVGSSLGVVVALILSVLIINRKNKKLICMSFLGGGLILFCILYSDLPIFSRIRNVIDIWQSLTWDDWKNISQINLYELQSANAAEEGMRNDNTSSIWRFQHWIKLIADFFSNIEYSPFVGLGDNYAAFYHVLVPHNDWLKLLVEYGLFVFVTVIYWVNRFCKIIHKELIYYLFLTAIIYHMTENLITAFPANCILYICAGYWYKKCIYKHLHIINI